MSSVCTLPAELTIYTVGELHPLCLSWLDADPTHPDRLAVDAQAVQEVDAAGVQLLLSLSHALAARGRLLCLQAPSPSLTAACRALGLPELSSPELAAGEPA